MDYDMDELTRFIQNMTTEELIEFAADIRLREENNEHEK